MSGFLSLQWNNHSLAFLNLLNSLHSKELYCDATIACHGKFYPVHRMVLSTCSEYFQEIFNLTQCKHPFIIINDAQPSQLEALLEYMYKGNINVPQKDLPNLLKAAEGLRIKGLAVPDNLSTDKELSKKRSSSQTSSSKKLKVSNKEKEDNDSRRGSLNNDSKDTPDTNVFEDNRECIIEENPPIKQEPIDPENNDAVTKSKLGNELPNNIDENVVKSEPYDPSYADAHQNQVQLQYPNNTEWALNNGNDQINQQSFPDQTLSEIRREGINSNCAAMASPFVATSTNVLNQFVCSSNDPINLNEDVFSCDQCSYKCRFKGNLRRHVKQVHTRERPFVCSICPYRSVSKDIMILHMRKHTGEKPFPCLICGVRFSARSNHIRHMKMVHNSRNYSCNV